MNTTRVTFHANTHSNVLLDDKLDESSTLEQRVIATLCTIFDPELPVNIYELGLIYNIDINADFEVKIQMTLTAPGCPVAGSLPGQVEVSIKNIEGISDAHVELVWEPPWDANKMSDEAKLTLGMF